MCDIGESTGDIFNQLHKNHCGVNELEAKYIEKISHVLIGNSVVGPYQFLKQTLLKTFKARETFKLNKLLSLPPIDLGQNLKRLIELLLEMRSVLRQPSPRVQWLKVY